jgi:hypothetical protein
MDYNIALQWAYCDITGKPRWTDTPKTKSLSDMYLVPNDMQPFELRHGHFGNLVYDNNQ